MGCLYVRHLPASRALGPHGLGFVANLARARISRHVTCSAVSAPALVTLDPWYAVRMHALGNSELRVRICARWPEHRNCGHECLAQIGTVA